MQKTLTKQTQSIHHNQGSQCFFCKAFSKVITDNYVFNPSMFSNSKLTSDLIQKIAPIA